MEDKKDKKWYETRPALAVAVLLVIVLAVVLREHKLVSLTIVGLAVVKGIELVIKGE